MVFKCQDLHCAVSLSILQFLFGCILCLRNSSPLLVNLAFKFNKHSHGIDRQHFDEKDLVVPWITS